MHCSSVQIGKYLVSSSQNYGVFFMIIKIIRNQKEFVRFRKGAHNALLAVVPFIYNTVISVVL